MEEPARLAFEAGKTTFMRNWSYAYALDLKAKELKGKLAVSPLSSFGSLRHLRPEQRPAGAGDRCLVCAIEPGCAFSARKLYLGMAERGETGWPVEVVAWPPPRHEVGAVSGGHAGGDDGVIADFVAAVAAGDPGLMPTTPAETLESHRIAFAAEAARRGGSSPFSPARSPPNTFQGWIT
jgi:hypothetical protein